jgi:hypothetical protein
VVSTTVQFLGVGTCIVTAEQAGNLDYKIAAPVTHSVAVTKESSLTVLHLSSSRILFGSEQVELLKVTVTPKSAAVGATGDVMIVAGSARVCLITLVRASGSCRLQAKQLRVGAYRIAAKYDGSSDINPSTSLSATLDVKS